MVLDQAPNNDRTPETWGLVTVWREVIWIGWGICEENVSEEEQNRRDAALPQFSFLVE